MAGKIELAVFFFYSDSCASCKPLLKAFRKVADEYHYGFEGAISFVPINYDTDNSAQGLMNLFGVEYLPSFAFQNYATSEVLKKIDAADWATEGTIRDALTELNFVIPPMEVGVDILMRLKRFSWPLAIIAFLVLASVIWFWYYRTRKKK